MTQDQTTTPDQRFRDVLSAARWAVADDLDLDDRDRDLLDLMEDVAIAMLSHPEGGVTVADVMERREHAGYRTWMG